MNFRAIAVIAIAVCISAAAFYFGTGLHPIWWLVWIAPLPILLMSTDVRGKSCFLAAFVAYFAGGTNMWKYLHNVIGIPVFVTLAALILPSVVFAFAILISRKFTRLGRPWFAVLALPTVWVTYEYSSAITSPHSTFGNLAYSQMDFLPLIQIASICGIWGISFAVLLVSSTLAIVFGHCCRASSRWSVGIIAGVVLLAILGFGTWRLSSAPTNPSVSITLIAKDAGGTFPESDADSLALLSKYADAIRRVSLTRVVILPEKIASVSEHLLPQVDRLFTSVASDTHAEILVGIVRRTSAGAYNESRLYASTGLQASYDKHHLIPGIEKELPGFTRTTVADNSGLWGLTICKDMDFPGLSRQYGMDGVGLLLVPAWDFRVDGWLHSRMAVLRGVESGFSVARAARDGLLTASDSRGKVIAEKPSSSKEFSVLRADLPVSAAQTFYSRTGDWFAWLNAATVLLLVLTLLFRSMLTRYHAFAPKGFVDVTNRCD